MSKPANCISVKEGQDLLSHWVATRGNSLSSSSVGQDAHDVFFTLAELQEYLDYVKDESNKQGISNPGIRIFFGAYNESNNDRSTVFLAPTDSDDNNSGNNYNIDPFNRGGTGWPPNAY